MLLSAGLVLQLTARRRRHASPALVHGTSWILICSVRRFLRRGFAGPNYGLPILMNCLNFTTLSWPPSWTAFCRCVRRHLDDGLLIRGSMPTVVLQSGLHGDWNVATPFSVAATAYHKKLFLRRLNVTRSGNFFTDEVERIRTAAADVHRF
jgi:hypothetical protein